MSETPPGGKPTYGSAARVAQIIHWLHQFPYGMSLESLCERLDVSERTLARYIKALEETFADDGGEPLVEVTRAGKKGRLRFRRKGVQMKGSAYELMSLYLALGLMAFLEGTFIQEGARDALDRMQANLLRDHGHETSLILKDFHKKFFHWTEAPKDYSAHNEILDQCVKALVLQREVHMRYRPPGKPEKMYHLRPLTLLMFKRALYLVARLLENGEDIGERTFAVERIHELTLGENGFYYPGDYNPAQRFRDTFGLVSADRPERVELWFSDVVAQNVSSRRWHGSQETEPQPDGSIRLTMTLDITSELVAWILSYGKYAEVLTPESLRKRISEELAAALDRYC
jgi:proteasome accessory factor B